MLYNYSNFIFGTNLNKFCSSLFVQTYFDKQIKPAVSTPPNSDWHNGDSVPLSFTQAHQHAQAAVAAFLGSQVAAVQSTPLQQLATSSKMVNGGPVDTRPIPPIPGPPTFRYLLYFTYLLINYPVYI